ncbi:hypothetical protein L228DRAFT_265579 [Xylona heveae TC161]|uniref:RRM domain-containing protein n=1 Tax=Xylona heveae (strain CBS 132557 / TC161) TaxID=1328760 RepID=A0A165IMB1_XYLHT|nr:hypothetical protein L228DRAFT_265579 [Xylona heveae TC161]KZF25101.1 hypothetical protein L228DRAFT_265579 [Xylona heveae TC161]
MANNGSTPGLAKAKEEDYFLGVSGLVTAILATQLPPRFKWQDLKDHIRKITPRIGANSVHVPVLPTGQSQGVGIVRIRGKDEAEKVYVFLSTHPCDGSMLQVKMCPASATNQAPSGGTCPPPISSMNPGAFSPVSRPSMAAFQPEPAKNVYIVNPTMDATPLAVPMNHPEVALGRTPFYGPQYAAPPLSPGNFAFQPALLGHPFPPRMADPVPYATPQPFVVPPAAIPYLVPGPAYPAGMSGPIYANATDGTPVNVSHGAVRTESTSVFIGNLSYEARWQDIKCLMERVGSVQKCNLITDSKTGKSRGCATVSFGLAQEAEQAIATFHDTTFMNRKIIVRADKEASSLTTGGRVRGSNPAVVYPLSQQPVIANGSTNLRPAIY